MGMHAARFRSGAAMTHLDRHQTRVSKLELKTQIPSGDGRTQGTVLTTRRGEPFAAAHRPQPVIEFDRFICVPFQEIISQHETEVCKRRWLRRPLTVVIRTEAPTALPPRAKEHMTDLPSDYAEAVPRTTPPSLSPAATSSKPSTPLPGTVALSVRSTRTDPLGRPEAT